MEEWRKRKAAKAGLPLEPVEEKKEVVEGEEAKEDGGEKKVSKSHAFSPFEVDAAVRCSKRAGLEKMKGGEKKVSEG